jgi:hypothetical protein
LDTGQGTNKEKGVQDTPTLKEERIPIKNELKRIFLAGDEKSRSTCVLLAHGGLRPETVGNYKGKRWINSTRFSRVDHY